MGIIQFLKTMSIKNKIRLISILPLVFVVILSFYININIYQKVSQLKDMKEFDINYYGVVIYEKFQQT